MVLPAPSSAVGLIWLSRGRRVGPGAGEETELKDEQEQLGSAHGEASPRGVDVIVQLIFLVKVGC